MVLIVVANIVWNHDIGIQWNHVFPWVSISTIIFTKRYTPSETTLSVIISTPIVFILTYVMSNVHMHDTTFSTIETLSISLAAMLAYSTGQLVCIKLYILCHRMSCMFQASIAYYIGIVYDTVSFYGVYAFRDWDVVNQWLALCLNDLVTKSQWAVMYGIPIMLLLCFTMRRYKPKTLLSA